MVTQISRASLRRQAIFWLSAFLFFGVFLYVFRGILLPFVAGMALAYFLDPVADRLESWGVSRLIATVLILFAFLLIFIVALMIVVPVLASQASGLISKLPEYVSQLQSLIASVNLQWVDNWIGSELPDLKTAFSDLLSQGAGLVGQVFLQVWNSGKALADIASLFVVTPVVAFYLLLDWDKMIESSLLQNPFDMRLFSP